jgi:hypothetical protein
MTAATGRNTRARGRGWLVALLAGLSAFMPLAAPADDAAKDATDAMPADAATHGQPMKMHEIMPTEMKKDGMTKGDVLKGEMANRKMMDEALRAEQK